MLFGEALMCGMKACLSHATERGWFGAITVLLAFGAVGCVSMESRRVVPEKLVSEAEIAELPGVRVWGDASADEINAVIRKAGLSGAPGAPAPYRPDPKRAVNILAISGGADDGAFGAGLLVGWSEAGTRPQFDLVTGVSAGALIAPLAFIGRSRDGDLSAIFTRYAQSDILSVNLVPGLLAGSAIADSTPLARLIAQYVDRRLLQEVAVERRKGRLLLIGTTNLEAQRPVLWDMGRIAMSDHPYAVKLFRKILLASASAPGVFPPVRLEVQATGSAYHELHVDGGVTQQVFVAPTRFPFGGVGDPVGEDVRRRLYVIRNGKISPEWQPVEERTLAIATRSISTLIKNHGVGDLYRIYAAAKRDGIDFNLASIPTSFTQTSKEPFDPAYMTALYETGYRLGRTGYSWLKAPPGLERARLRLSEEHYRR